MDQSSGGKGGWITALQYNDTHITSCYMNNLLTGLLLELVVWEKHVVQPATKRPGAAGNRYFNI